MSVQAQIDQCVRQLAESDTGRDTIGQLAAWLYSSGCNLDQLNRQAVADLITLAWSGHAGSVLDALSKCGVTHENGGGRESVG